MLAGDGHPALAHAVAGLCGATLAPLMVGTFADGETRVRIEESLTGQDVYIVQPTAAPTNERLLTLALIADAARGAGAAHVTAVVPYFGYARQDVRKSPGEPRSARLAGRLLREAGVDRIVAVELHSPALESAFDMPLVHLDADAAVMPAVRAWKLDDLTVVSPDAGGMKRAQRYAGALAAPLAVIAKARSRDDVVQAVEVLGRVRDRNCLIVDDITSTGRTIAESARALHAAGAAQVHAVFVHAVMAAGALTRIHDTGLRRILTTDSVRTVDDPRVEVVSVAPLLAQAITRLAAGQA
jgi:ribose-phosphate pyrophosphokinase